MNGPYTMKFFGKCSAILFLVLLTLPFGSTQAQINESKQEEKARFIYQNHLESCKSFQREGNISKAREQLDSARYFFRRELGLNHPDRAFINIELANIQRLEGDLNSSIASLQRALGSLQANVRSRNLDFNPSPAFNLRDSIIIRLLIKKSRFLLEQAGQSKSPLSVLRLSKKALVSSLSWMQFTCSYGWWLNDEERAINLLKRISSLGLQLSQQREQLLGESLLDERSFWLKSYFQIKTALQTQVLEPFPSDLVPDSLNREILHYQRKLINSRKEYLQWVSANGSNNLQTVIIKENILADKAALDESINAASKFAPGICSSLRPVWLQANQKVDYPSCLDKHTGLINYFSTKDSIYCYYRSFDIDKYWTYSKAELLEQSEKLNHLIQSKSEQAEIYEAYAFKLFKGLIGPIVELGLPKKLWIVADYELLDFPFEGLVYSFVKEPTFEDLNYLWRKTELNFQKTWSTLCFQEDYSSAKALCIEFEESLCEDRDYRFSEFQLSENQLTKLDAEDYARSYWQFNQFPDFFKKDIQQQNLNSKLIVWNTENPANWSSGELSQRLFLAGSPNLLFNLQFSCDKEEQHFWKSYYSALTIGIGKRKALQQAIRSQVNKGGSYALPKYWLGKRYIGDPIPLKKRYKIFAMILLWISLSLASLVVVVLLIRMRKKFLQDN